MDVMRLTSIVVKEASCATRRQTGFSPHSASHRPEFGHIWLNLREAERHSAASCAIRDRSESAVCVPLLLSTDCSGHCAILNEAKVVCSISDAGDA